MKKEFDFVEANTVRLPAGYPAASIPDTYAREPIPPDFDRRKQMYLEYCAENPAQPTLKGFLYELARLALNREPVNTRAIEGALQFINKKLDCSDFVLLGILRMVLQFNANPLLTEDILNKTRDTILAFKYWPDEPGRDSMCTWTENHQVLFSTCEYLAGMMYPSEVFTNCNMKGIEKMEKARIRLLKWMELRFRTGFNEWLSNVYYDEDIAALLTLADFCDDPLLTRGASCILDLLFYDMALNSFRGTFGCTHGRSYWIQKKSGCNESTADTQKIAFGMGVFGAADSMSGINLALSRYRLPKVICDIAADTGTAELENRQRIGIKISEARRWGLDFEKLDDGMALLSFEAYNHPKTIRLFLKMLDSCNWWENEFFRPFNKIKRPLLLLNKLRLLSPVVWLLRKDIARNMREEVHTLTSRTPDYMLSAALDYKKGFGGDQHHIWQATLSEDAVVFTTHPGSLTHRSPDYWTGSGFLPRVAMHKNVLICIYRISSTPGLYMKNKYNFTHAFFPKHHFDEVAEVAGWTFGRTGNGYIALYSQNGYRWQTEGEEKNAELVADGKKNIWICEMGREATHGTFAQFQKAVSSAKIIFRGLNLVYHSPSIGELAFGWKGPFRINDKKVPLRDQLRYNNPYSKVAFDPEVIEVKKGTDWLRLELNDYRRAFSKQPSVV
ncbi:MAG: hypothetical protein C4520_15905 [Candidatus Abyssobacteria bacterium SURF_5]|uniref:Uncharacterized protein n=1 Tax=Abyssobacteria bacterium (strain SURF_5) TaxID=2093360 RepID=A0A3A4NPK0_ABYX5|nr:MAG: hypothetical protein C4520_15905 [Candidatus Abyssubacteria bacterium SURF_5]